jgi:hypothetical protein
MAPAYDSHGCEGLGCRSSANLQNGGQRQHPLIENFLRNLLRSRRSCRLAKEEAPRRESIAIGS